MAKSLKIKLKNAQLANALQLNKEKKEKAEALKREEEEKKKQLSAPPPPKEKAEATPANAPVKKDAPPPTPTAPTPTTSTSVPKKEAPKEEKRAEKVERKEESRSLQDLKKREKELPQKPENQGEGYKAHFSRNQKEARKKQDSRFDARDRQGLRVGEDSPYRRRSHRRFKQKRNEIEAVRPTSLSVRLPITIKDLAQAMKLKASALISKLFMQGIALTINDDLDDATTIELLGHEFNCTITIDTAEEKRLRITDKTIQEEIATTSPDLLESRAPVVAFMGHVDHGKTSLIDAIRKSNIAGGEAGAITQHIGAFKCQREHGVLTVLDTPGHAAFTLMRRRGTTVTDVVVLVVAGDEGIMPQTDEAIALAKEAEIPLVVAINKCDKQNFNAENIYRQLADRELLPEAWGGAVITINCSAQTGEGIPDLLEMLALQSDVLELKANPQTRGRGMVIESELHKGFGPIATVLVQNGTLNLGDALIFEELYGRIKTMHDEHGKAVSEAPPSTPVKITGLSGVPAAGCEFIVVGSEKEARKLSEQRLSGTKREKLKREQNEFDALIFRHQELEAKKVVKLVLRADVQGSVEALKNSLLEIKSDKVELVIISEGVGQISESDVQLASASNAVIIGFHSQVESHADALIKEKKVVIKRHNIIYQVIDDVKAIMVQALDKIRQETFVGCAEVRQLFQSSQLGLIAGCMVTDGVLKKEHHVKLYRAEKLIYEGSFASLKRVKEDVKEVSKGMECGILLNKFKAFEEGDLIKGFAVTYVEPEL